MITTHSENSNRRPLEEVIKIAEQAKNYARKSLIKGSTRIENNELPMESFEYLRRGLGEQKRGLYQKAGEKVGYELIVIKEKEFEQIEKRNSLGDDMPILVLTKTGDYKLWGSKNGVWQITNIDRKELEKVEWKKLSKEQGYSADKIFVHRHGLIFDSLLKGHDLVGYEIYIQKEEDLKEIHRSLQGQIEEKFLFQGKDELNLSHYTMPILVAKKDGNYLLWGRKHHESWEVTEINQKELNDEEKDVIKKMLLGKLDYVFIDHHHLLYKTLKKLGHTESAQMSATGTRNIINQETLDRINSGESYFLANYEARIITSMKYSLGNCDELSFQAFDDILNHGGGITAGIYKVGFDHVVVVVNLDLDDNKPFDLEKCDKEVVICDPLYNLVFPASEYKSYLKTFHRAKDMKLNVADEFNEGKTVLEPYLLIDPDTGKAMKVNTDTIRQLKTELKSADFKEAEHITNLKNKFMIESTKLINTVEMYKKDLEVEIARLISQHGAQSIKANIIKHKCEEIDLAIETIMSVKEIIEHENFKNSDQPPDYVLGRFLTTLYQDAIRAMCFSEEEQKQLFEFAPEKSKRYKKLMMFFKSDTQTNLERITGLVNDSIAANKRDKK